MYQQKKSVITRNGRFNLYHRKGSCRYQAYLKPNNGTWEQYTTGKVDFEEAKEAATEKLIELRMMIDADIPIREKRFKEVALLTIKKLEADIKNGVAEKISTKTKIGAMKKLFIPFFGTYPIERITDDLMGDFAIWRNEQYGRKLKSATVKNQFTALRLVFSTAKRKGWMKDFQEPNYDNTGLKAERRPYFTEAELCKISEFMCDRDWYENGKNEKQTNPAFPR